MKLRPSRGLLAAIVSVGVLGLLTAGAARADMVTYTGDFSSTTLGSTLSTDLPQFNSALGTLTGVQITLNMTVTPYASAANFGSPSTPLIFDPTSWTSATFSPAIGNWTVSYATDSWTLTAPTVSTGDIYGSNQSVPFPTILSFTGATSASASLTNVSGSDLSAYIGSGNLVFGITGPGTWAGGGPFYNYGYGYTGGGANLTSTDGTESVTYDYSSVPEPASMGLMAMGGIGLLINRRKKA
ncbi:MAG TPA: choice-of-anchor E domain-containing protein [Phycisphaerae bacterium]|nr:choice-of-anchor E domain-containing protein [Phycisphaerae bacterium]